MRDVIIIGAGAAGLSAALVLARAQRDVLVLDAGEPRNATAAHLHGFVSRDGMAPAEFLAVGRREVAGYGGVVTPAHVAEITRSEGHFSVTTDDGSVERARAVLVATGVKDDVVDIPGLWERWGRTVHHCPYCHGHEVLGQQIVVIGALKLAGLLRAYSDRITLVVEQITAVERDRLEAFGVRVLDGMASAINDDGVTLVGGAVIPCEAVFVAPVPRANDELLRALGCTLDSDRVRVDAAGQTSSHGVWAAGNVVTPTAQIISAAGAASVSAIAINGWLLQQDMDAALGARTINRKET